MTPESMWRELGVSTSTIRYISIYKPAFSLRLRHLGKVIWPIYRPPLKLANQRIDFVDQTLTWGRFSFSREQSPRLGGTALAHIDYYFSVLSPFTYLAGDRLEQVAAKHGVAIAYKPVNVRKLFAEMGGTPPGERHIARQEYRLQDLKHLQKASGLPINLHPTHWPTDQKPASAMIVAAAKTGQDAGKLAQAVLRAVWAEEKDIADGDTLVEIAQSAGIDLEAVKPHLAEGAAAFETLTAEAKEAGAFGSPFYIVDGERFWGQDRLDHLDTHLSEL